MPKVVVTPEQNGGVLVHDPTISVNSVTSNGQGNPAGMPYTTCTCTCRKLVWTNIPNRVWYCQNFTQEGPVQFQGEPPDTCTCM